MRIAIATVQVPFIRGGAEMLADGLRSILRGKAHDAEIVTMPFRFVPDSEVRRTMEVWENEDFEVLNGFAPDLVICLKFPAYYLRHSNKVLWLLHQHRLHYDLWDNSKKPTDLKKTIAEKDCFHIKNCRKIFTISPNVSNRLWTFNQIDSTPLYHPPPLAKEVYCGASEPYIFFPSRLEPTLKRQPLLIEAMRFVKSPVVALIAGKGRQESKLQDLVAKFGLEHRVRLLGETTEEELLAYYAHCLAVFFGPYNEDYGYVTLEAMLAAKPVITCMDSGGPLEFVVDRETGFIVNPEPEAVAEAMDYLYANPVKASRMGLAGKKRYEEMNISWENVVENLL